MATKVIGDYTAAVTIDGSTHYLLIQPGNSSTAYNKINRNVFLGVTGQPMDISTSQTVSNKVLNNTNSITIKDTLFTLQDDADATKQAQFQLSGITTATTRVYTLPNASGTLVDTTSTQTLSGKTLTSPIINGGSIDNATITVDTIAGHTVAGNGTVYGLNIQSGVIQTANAGKSNFLQTNAVQGNQLATNAITLGYTQITANITTTSTTQTQATGLSATVTVPAGGRRVKVTVYANLQVGTGIKAPSLSLWSGTVGSGTQMEIAKQVIPNVGNDTTFVCMASAVPAAGSVTYNVGWASDGGGGVTTTMSASATAPAWILVEAI